MTAPCTEPAAELAQRLVDTVNARLDTAHHEWEPARVLTHAVIAVLVDALDLDPVVKPNAVQREFLLQLRDHAAATLPHNTAEPPREATRYTTVLIADTLQGGKNLAAALGLPQESTLVVSLAVQLRGLLLPDDVEVMDRSDRMSVAQRRLIDHELEICKASSAPR